LLGLLRRAPGGEFHARVAARTGAVNVSKARHSATSTRLLAPDAAGIEAAARVLGEGGLLAFPTETVYGLGANALDAAAVARVFEAKGRPSTNPLIVHLAGVEAIAQVAADWPDVAARLAERFWPGHGAGYRTLLLAWPTYTLLWCLLPLAPRGRERWLPRVAFAPGQLPAAVNLAHLFAVFVAARALAPSLMDFDTWLAKYRSRIPL